MKIKIRCKCGELLEIDLNENNKVISVEYLNDNIVEISNEEAKILLNKNSIELG